MIERIDIAGVALLALAAFGLYHTQDQRATSAASYAEAARYNRATTDFVVRNRARLAGRNVAVFGLTGLSPWSHTTGRYLERGLSAPASWRVYVPHADTFYPYGERPQSRIAIKPETQACELGDQAIYVVFDPRGNGSLARDCNTALSLAYPVPVIEQWTPRQVDAQTARRGFDIAFTGSDFNSAVALRINGVDVPVVRGQGGRLMTATVPKQDASLASIPLEITHRGRVVHRDSVRVGPR